MKLYTVKWAMGGDTICTGRTLITAVNKFQRYERGRGVGKLNVYVVDEKGVVCWDQGGR